MVSERMTALVLVSLNVIYFCELYKNVGILHLVSIMLFLALLSSMLIAYFTWFDLFLVSPNPSKP